MKNEYDDNCRFSPDELGKEAIFTFRHVEPSS